MIRLLRARDQPAAKLRRGVVRLYAVKLVVTIQPPVASFDLTLIRLIGFGNTVYISCELPFHATIC